MRTSSIRILIVEDFEQWRRFYVAEFEKQVGFQFIAEVSDGLEGVQKAQQLKPDLILLDIGLPTLNGIEVARRIREVSAASKIVFVTENRSVEIVQEALSTGAGGYVVKSDAGSELLPAVNAVLEGKRFVSAAVAGYGFDDPSNQPTAHYPQPSTILRPEPQNLGITRHEVGFYSEDRHFLDHVAQFIGEALKAGGAAIVMATDTHRESLLLELHGWGLDMSSAIQEDRYISLDAADVLSKFMVGGMPHPVRVLELLGDLIARATKAAKAERSRVAVFGECVHLLWEEGYIEAAIQIEKLGNTLPQIHAVDILCGYCVGKVAGGMPNDVFQQICAEHSAVHSL